jgi:3-hydroxy-9,10-secoandrosta-1,3,5(10)-triene-9,17-dione monooxygenase reductase component
MLASRRTAVFDETIDLEAFRRKPFDPREFRAALGCFATGVCIMTTRRPDGKREGLTCNSFSSVSLTPPMVLWSLSRKAQSVPAFVDTAYFAVNVLAAEQQEIAAHFARAADDKFTVIEHLLTEGFGGAPLIEGCAARFECRNQFQNYGGDHIVFIGTVERFAYWDRLPLLFHRGHYGTLGPPDEP